jgi:hypothetical protein
MLTRRLEMIFQNTNGGRASLSVQDPNDDLMENDVRTAMETIIDKNIFTTSGGDLARIMGARIVTTEVADIITGE